MPISDCFRVESIDIDARTITITRNKFRKLPCTVRCFSAVRVTDKHVSVDVSYGMGLSYINVGRIYRANMVSNKICDVEVVYTDWEQHDLARDIVVSKVSVRPLANYEVPPCGHVGIGCHEYECKDG